MTTTKPRKKREHPNKSKTRPQRVASAQHDVEIVRLRIRGYSLKEIGEAVRLSIEGVRKRLLVAFDEANKQKIVDVEYLRELELQRLDVMLKAMMTKIDDGDTAAVQAALRIMEQRTRYLAIALPPVKQEAKDGDAPDVSLNFVPATTTTTNGGQ